MTRLMYAAMALAFLAACDGVGGDGGDTDPVTPPPDETPTDIPEDIAGDLKAASFNASDDTMTIRITLDADALDAVYTRNDLYDVPGYIAFTTQDDPLDRFFTAFHASSSDGSVRAALVVDGGQFTKYFGGTTYSQTDIYSPPAEGQVSYAGNYIGMINFGTRDGTLASDQSEERLPARAIRVTGDVFLNANFADATVNGIIDNRVLADTIGGPFVEGYELPSLFLIPAGIAQNGSFAGEVENRAQEGLGSYAGTFGGTNAAGVAGGVRLTGDFFPEVDEEEEYGIFVLDQCGNTPDVCLEVDGINE